MKSSKKMFILVECILGCLLIGMIIFTVQKRQGQDLKRISVIIQNSDETQWSAFKYGLKMAAQDENVDVIYYKSDTVSDCKRGNVCYST